MIFRVFLSGDFLPFESNFAPGIRVALKVRLIVYCLYNERESKNDKKIKKTN